MNKEALGIILGTGLLGLAKSKLSGSVSTLSDLILQKKLKVNPNQLKIYTMDIHYRFVLL